MKKRLLFFLMVGFLIFVSLPANAAINFSFPCPPSGMGLGGCVESETSIPNYILRFYQFGVGIAGILAVGMIVVGAITISLSGAIDKQKEGKDMIKNAIWGVVLLLGSYLILNTVNPELTKLKEPALPKLEPCVYANGIPTNEPCIPKPYQFESLPFETEPEISTSTDVANFCKQVAPTRNDCAYGTCHVSGETIIGCDGFVGFITPFMKKDQCRWGNEPSNCYVHQKTLEAFNRLVNNPIPAIFEITEAYPPTDPHDSGGHYNGCSIDIKIKGTTAYRAFCEDLNKLIEATRNAGFEPHNEYPACGGARSENFTGQHLHLRTANCP